MQETERQEAARLTSEMRNESTLAGYTNLGYYRGETRVETEKIINKTGSFR